MKKFYLIATAVTMLTACTNSEKLTADFSNDGPVMIGFETFHEKATKATPTGEIIDKTKLTKEHGGFGVWGYKGSETDIKAASGEPKTVNIENPSEENAKYTTIFNNVQVWYVSDDYATTPSQGFTYTVPKYWDKGMEYIFFAYAPYDSENNASIDRATGNITIANIASIQNVCKSNADETPAEDDLKYDGSSTSGVTDYLIATYVTDQKLVAQNTTSTPTGTNQNYVDSNNGKNAAYTYQEQTVGFTFGHMLSKLKINLQASSDYSGIEYIKVNSLSIKNIPASSDVKTSFTQISPTEPKGNYTPSAYTSELKIIGTGGTSTSSLYILKDGSKSGETVTKPTHQTQSFNYYVAPNKPVENNETPTIEGKYLLNIAYTIHYVDNIEENVAIPNVDLSTKLDEMLQNNAYTLTIKVGLNQIFFTVDAVTDWVTENNSQEIEIK